MNKKELIEAVIELPVDCSGPRPKIDQLTTLELVKLLDEPEKGHADEAPRYVKNILARLRELPVHDREVWLKVIMGEFEQDFSHAKWREGYEQGKLEGEWVGQQLKNADKIRQELNKPVIPQFVADYIEFKKENDFHVYGAMRVIEDHYDKRVPEWFYDKNIETFARAWLDGYEVEKEKRYTVVMKETKQPLYYNAGDKKLFFSMAKIASHFTKQQLEKLNFGWVFDCEGVEIEKVE